MTYVYESQSYRDKETKQPRSKRKLIGRLDDETIKKLSLRPAEFLKRSCISFFILFYIGDSWRYWDQDIGA